MKKTIKTLFTLGITAFCAMLFFGVNGKAYIDPSVMTYMIQAIAGLVIAIGAAVGIYFRRAKKKLNETLNIDENRNKEVETDNIVVDESEKK